MTCEEVVVCSRTTFVLYKLELNTGALEERDSVYEKKEKNGKLQVLWHRAGRNTCSWITKSLFKHGSLQGTIKLVLTWKDFVGGAEESGKLHKLGNQNLPNSIK